MAETIPRITADTLVTTTELAAILGISGRRVQQMIQDGTLRTVSKGKLELGDSVQRYAKSKRAQPVDMEDAQIEKGRRKAEMTMKASKATIARLEAQELQGKMHRSEDVAAEFEDLVYTVRDALNALPGRLAVDVARANIPAEASEIIRKEVYKIMRELAAYRYDPQKYEERVRARRNWSEREDDDDDDDE